VEHLDSARSITTTIAAEMPSSLGGTALRILFLLGRCYSQPHSSPKDRRLVITPLKTNWRANDERVADEAFSRGELDFWSSSSEG